jgi:hypothetical protein
MSSAHLLISYCFKILVNNITSFTHTRRFPIAVFSFHVLIFYTFIYAVQNVRILFTFSHTYIVYRRGYCDAETNLHPYFNRFTRFQHPWIGKRIEIVKLLDLHSFNGAGYRSRYSDWLRAGRPSGRSSIRRRVKNFLFSTSSRPALRSIQPPIHWVRGALSRGLKRPGVKLLTIHLYLVPESRKCGSIHPLLHTPSWRSN